MSRKEHQTTPKIMGRFLYTDVAAVPLDTPTWFDWLAQHTTFYLDSPLGTFTARREPRANGVFWYVFRRYHKRLYKAWTWPHDTGSCALLVILLGDLHHQGFLLPCDFCRFLVRSRFLARITKSDTPK
jgi:hypothetical protein